LSHLWQRFVLAAALVFGLALGVAATIFGYSNTGTVDLGFSVVHLKGIPLWTVAIVPLVLVLAAGTLYHWWNSLHHFSEHMRHRHRVRELEAEVASLKSRLDELLEMPGHAEIATGSVVEPVVAPVETVESLTKETVPMERVAPNGEEASAKKGRKREPVTPAAESLPENIEEKNPEPTVGP